MVDAWGFGMILYVLCCGKLPFDDRNTSSMFSAILSGNFVYPEYLSDCIISILLPL